MGKMIAVTGRGGRLDSILVNRFGFYRIQSDILNQYALRRELDSVKPDVIINCAAYTNVDGAETDTLECSLVNTAGVMNLREFFLGKIIQLSTNFVFDGFAGLYKEEDITNPLGWYGWTKDQAEKYLLEIDSFGDCIIRTTVLYGSDKNDFASNVLRALKKGIGVTLPENLYGNPTHVFHLAKAIAFLVGLEKYPKIVHICGKEDMSRYLFAIKLAEHFGYSTSLIQPTSEICGIAKRPKRAGLDTSLAESLGIPIYSVDDGIEQLFVEKANIYGQYPIR